MKHGALLRKGTSKNIKVFILLRFTEFEKMLPFYKNISVFVYRSRQSDKSIEMWVRVKMWSCRALNLCSSLRRNSMGRFFEYIFGITITVLKISQNNDNRGRLLEFYFHTGIGNWFQCFPVYPGLNLSSAPGSSSISGSGSGFRIPAFLYALNFSSISFLLGKLERPLEI